VDWGRKVAEEEAQRAARELEAEREAREAAKGRGRRAAQARREREAPLREARKEAEKAEEEVHVAEEALAGLRKALDDPRLYDGSADRAREAGRLNREIRKTQEALDRAMAWWAEAVETLEGLEGG
jgi:hypothetical protein